VQREVRAVGRLRELDRTGPGRAYRAHCAKRRSRATGFVGGERITWHTVTLSQRMQLDALLRWLQALRRPYFADLPPRSPRSRARRRSTGVYTPILIPRSFPRFATVLAMWRRIVRAAIPTLSMSAPRVIVTEHLPVCNATDFAAGQATQNPLLLPNRCDNARSLPQAPCIAPTAGSETRGRAGVEQTVLGRAHNLLFINAQVMILV
jgi:hypothetical protein